MGESREKAISRAAAGHVYTDIYEEAIDSLEMTARFLEEAVSEPRRWKWVVIALNTAIHNCMVLVLKGTWDVGIQHRDVRVKKLTAHMNLYKAIESGDDAAIADAHAKDREMIFTNKLDGIDWLYARIKDEEHFAMRYLGNDKDFVPGETCDKSMEQLKFIRDDYMHFGSGASYHDIVNLVDIAVDGLSVIEFLLGRERLIGWRRDDERKQRATVAFAQASTAASRLAEKYPRPTAEELEAMQSTGKTLSQMVDEAIAQMLAEVDAEEAPDHKPD